VSDPIDLMAMLDEANRLAASKGKHKHAAFREAYSLARMTMGVKDAVYFALTESNVLVINQAFIDSLENGHEQAE
jgi:hypothetical protein